MSYRQFIWVTMALVCFMLAGEACVPASVSLAPHPVEAVPPTTSTLAASPPPTSLDPEAIAAQLTPVATISKAAEQLAGLLGTTPDAVRVRVETPVVGACATCDRPPVGEFREKGVPVSEVALPLVPASAVWLTVQDVVCHYAYDGRELKPISVWISPQEPEP